MATKFPEIEPTFNRLDMFTRVEQEIRSLFDTIIRTVTDRRDDLLTILGDLKSKYIDEEKMRGKQVRELEKMIGQLDEMNLRQNPIVKLQGDYLQQMKDKLDQYEQPTPVPVPCFSIKGLHSLLQQLERIGTIQEMGGLYSGRINPILTIGKIGKNKGEFNWPHGICLDEESRVYVCDYFNTRIQVLSKTGKFISEFGKGQLYRPYNITIYDDSVFVSDDGLNAVFKFRISDHRLVSKSVDGELNLPRGLTVDKDEVFVADYDNHRIAVLNSELKCLSEIGKPVLKYPCDVKINLNKVYVADYNKPHSVHIFSKSGDVLYNMITLRFGTVHIFMCFDQFNNIIISDSQDQSIQVFTSDGQMKHYIKSDGYVRGVEVTTNNTILCAVGDPHCVKLY